MPFDVCSSSKATYLLHGQRNDAVGHEPTLSQNFSLLRRIEKIFVETTHLPRRKASDQWSVNAGRNARA
jgi:hypothetical protein